MVYRDHIVACSVLNFACTSESSAASSLATLDDFVPVMLEAEEENYNLFKLINELNKEVSSRGRGRGGIHRIYRGRLICCLP